MSVLSRFLLAAVCFAVFSGCAVKPVIPLSDALASEEYAGELRAVLLKGAGRVW